MRNVAPTNLESSIFRAYDIRGIFGKDLNENAVELIGRAIASFLHQQNQQQVIIAQDCRLSSPRIYTILKQVLLESGCDVINIGLVPTPLLYFATHTLDCNNGIIITASHNPEEYNGFKIVIDKKPLSPQAIQSLYYLAAKPTDTTNQGKFSTVNITPMYLQSVLKDFPHISKLKVVIDCGNAVASSIAPILLKQLGCTVEGLHCEPNSQHCNYHPNPNSLNLLAKEVKNCQADLGITYDGDADRLFVVDEHGQTVSADQLIILFSEHILTKKAGRIIYDIKCSHHIARRIKTAGGTPIVSRTGHTFIKARIRETQALFAGEASGHFFFNDRWFGFDDALYATVRLLEILNQAKLSLSDLLSQYPSSYITPEINIDIDETDKVSFIQEFKEKLNCPDAHIINIDGIRVEFSDGWGLVRSSNTSPCLALRFEADSQAALARIKNYFKQKIKQLRPSLNCNF